MSRRLVKKGFSSFLLMVMMAAAVLYPTSTGHAATINVTDNGSRIEVNTGAGLVYTVNKTNGDIISAKMNGTELNGSSKGSHISSGLGSANVTWNTSPSGSTLLITVSTSTLTHYYASRGGENIIYMATYVTAEPSVGELRYIFRGNGSVLTGVPANSNNRNNTGAIESEDVFGYANGQSTSKYYGNDQAKDLTIRGVTGNGVGVFMAYGDREKSSGGPFFRDIQFQSGGDTEVYNYMNSGHAQTENWRMGLHGPYALIFTTGATPSVPDFSWMSSLNLTGWVSSRGNVVLNGLSGMDTGYTYTVGFANSNAQYWVNASSSGAAAKYSMIPGTYTMTVYKGELPVYTESVNVTGGSTTTLNTRTINNDPSKASSIWRIGNWDGTPSEFLNGQTIPLRHPSDSRNPSWGPVSYATGSATNKFPAIQFRGQNSPTTVTFSLNSSQAASSHVLNIGITAAYNNGRPSVTINGQTLTNPAASSQPNSRSFTIGTYRGNNTTFSWNIPASYFVTGANTVTITPISGSSDLGNWLSAGWVYDCVELLN
ncbi:MULTISPECIES: rhamnogalacturonan lyase B N-terminal domain-containing protein [unclassified Paenibacillus]|uniref:rhamnogalacturonan lyase B N-terminal domain-containing protein n=1 Tax=unclassified Paenibacillus TaxID=185978 RepID=UPI0009A67914|nr:MULTISPECIES: rhamnogalacturonan lyase B N-terminal domain-containing protein [unclassified Paenibacillus]SLK17549.1 rhamnogalacturonan endolyase [Paenibacillus sp. RU5A]SOC74836.1 rhamnogalacturonan endolyase [Paenibacillus sp. RU26A]SOC76955.1 rhamnogalacturonan endolyase [Paenibacillus sp. RU5M]